ncbi:hypothetical protein M9978_18810 [Sphingomonas sp. MG17]|uniref:Uncharacterized protein n=1 Tax=Sphingomonas tagetis TaxID=2949092 RepID=A0A9X2KR62_9SPHN|nr:hypothetical protein [Sphingomonas tagetis]MCP3732478.1 hypothetical protein [Sphingomonas tagetis]
MWWIVYGTAGAALLASFKGEKSAIWDGSTIGMSIGLVVAALNGFEFSMVAKCAAIGALCGLAAQMLTMFGDPRTKGA